MLGIAQGLMTELKALAMKKTPRGAASSLKESAVFQSQLAVLEAKLRASRAYLHTTLDDLWDKVERTRELTTEDAADLKLATTYAINQGVEVATEAYRAAGQTTPSSRPAPSSGACAMPCRPRSRPRAGRPTTSPSAASCWACRPTRCSWGRLAAPTVSMEIERMPVTHMKSNRKSKIHLAQFLVHGPTYHSLAMWRHPRTDHAAYRWDRPELYQHIARLCERGRFDMVFFADLNYISDTYRGSMEPALSYAVQAPEHDPIPLLSYMGAVTKHIGLGATFSTSHSHPFYAARLWATIDHLTSGRAAWNVVTSLNRNLDANFGADRPDADTRYDRADEYMEVCRKLWSSWDEDAVVMDRERPMFADASKVRRIEHAGRFFKSRGPLNVVRSPQNGPAILQAGTSGKGRDFAARYADAIFAIQPRAEDAAAYFADIKGRMSELGRDPDACKILFGLQPIVGATEEEAQRAAGGAQRAWCRPRAAWRSCPRISTSICRGCRPTR